jgi:ribosomal protein S18 acetylase RimI-like enzyme
MHRKRASIHMDATIRQSRNSDQDALLQLIIELQDYERAIDDRLLEGRTMAKAYFRALELRCCEQKGAILVAQVGEQVAGFAAVQAQVPSTDLDEPPGTYALVSDLAVLKAHRGRGIGRALLEAAEVLARQHGAADVRIGALAGNTAAESLYRALGYRPYLQIFSKYGAGGDR